VETSRASYIAGTYDVENHNDGRGDAATFNEIIGLAVSADGKTLYVADRSNFAVRQVDLATTQVTTLVANPKFGPLAPQQPGRRANEALREYWWFKDPYILRPTSISTSPDGALFVTDDILDWDLDRRRSHRFNNERTLSGFSVRKVVMPSSLQR